MKGFAVRTRHSGFITGRTTSNLRARCATVLHMKSFPKPKIVVINRLRTADRQHENGVDDIDVHDELL